MAFNSLLKLLRRKPQRRSAARKHGARAASVVGVENLEDRQLLTINFNFNYEGPINAQGLGFEDPNLGLARRGALEDAASQFGALFANNATIDIDVTSTNTIGGTLASAGSQYVVQGNPAPFGDIGVIRNKVLTSTDLNGTAADGTLDVNWGQNWEISANSADVDNTEFDFYSTIYHELMHAVGFASTIEQNGFSLFGVGPGQAANWALFDSFISTADRTTVIDSNGILGNAWATNSIGGNSANGQGLFFIGPSAVAANGGQPVGLYTPTTWDEGSSVSHLDTDNPAFTGMLMTHASPMGPGPRTLSAVEEGVLVDLGYSLINAVSIAETNGDTVVSDLGASDTFTVVLGRQPASNVVLDIINPDTGEVVASDTSLTFTPTTWDIPQTVTLTGQSDGLQDGDQTVQLTISVDDANSDASFVNFVDLFVTVTAVDDDGTVPNKPVLTAPEPLPDTNMPTFRWTFDANAFTYELIVTNLATGAVVQQAAGLTGVSHTFTSAFPDGAYSATLQATNAIGQNGPTSDPLVFSIGDTLIPEAPVIVSPALGTTVSDPRTPIVWTDVPGGFTSELYFLSAGKVTRITTPGVPDGNGNLSYTPITDFPEGSTAVWIRTFNPFDEAGPWSSPTRFTVDAVATPSKPVITAPLVDTTTNPFPEFAWTGDGTTYELWVAKRREGTGTPQVPAAFDRVIYVREHRGLSYTHFSALDNGDYRVWVRATNSAGERSEWSDMEEFSVVVPVPAKPILFASVSSDNGRPTFSWESTGGEYVPGTTFDLWVNNLSTGQSQVVRNTTLTGSSYQLDSELPQGRYRAWIRATTALGANSAWSSPVTFDIDILAPGRPTITGPVAPTNSTDGLIQTETPTFSWTTTPGAVRFELWVNHLDSRTSRIVHETQLTETSFTSAINLPQGNFRAWVRAFNAAGEVGDWSVPFDFSLDVPTPSTPVVTAPVANAVGTVDDATPTIKWTASTGSVTTYDLQLEEELSGNRLIDIREIPAAEYTPTDTLEESIYRVRVRGVNSVGETSDWSDWFTFRIDVPNATTPVPIAPTGTITDDSVTFEWQHTDGNVRYEILVRDLLRQESIVIRVSTAQLSLGNNTAVYTQDGFIDGTYRWWVRAFNSQGSESSWSNSQSFNVDAQASLDKDGDGLLNNLDIALVPVAVDSPALRPTAEDRPSATSAYDDVPESARVSTEQIVTVEADSSRAETQSLELLVQDVMAEIAEPSVQILMLERPEDA